MFALRLATPADLDDLVPRTRALNDHEGIEVPTQTLREAMSVLLASPSLGGVWVITRPAPTTAPTSDPTTNQTTAQTTNQTTNQTTDQTIGYAIVTFGFDLEFAGRDAWMTELWIDEAHRRTGAGAAAIELLVPELKQRGVGALHLQVRPENPARRLYERTKFVASPRIVMTRDIP